MLMPRLERGASGRAGCQLIRPANEAMSHSSPKHPHSSSQLKPYLNHFRKITSTPNLTAERFSFIGFELNCQMLHKKRRRSATFLFLAFPSPPSRVKQNNLVEALSLSPPHPASSPLPLPARQFLRHPPPPSRPPEHAASDGEPAAPHPRIRAARAQIRPPAAPPDVMSRPHLPKDHAFPRANGFFDGGPRRLCEIEEADAAAALAADQSWSGSPSQSTSPSSASSLPMSSCGQYMLHRVGKFDTLAGVAIKYGVEVMRREYSSRQGLWLLYYCTIHWNTRGDIK